MKNGKYFSLILLSVAFQSLGGIFGKYAALTLSSSSLIGVLTNIFYILSLGCFVLQAIVWQQALFHFPLSIAYPFMGLTNFIVLFSSAILFQEGITLANIIGLILIVWGIALFSYEIEHSI